MRHEQADYDEELGPVQRVGLNADQDNKVEEKEGGVAREGARDQEPLTHYTLRVSARGAMPNLASQ